MENLYDRKTLIVEDDAIAAKATLAAMAHFVRAERITCVSSAHEALARLAEENFSVVFLDVELQTTSGFALAEYIDRHHAGLPYVFLTGHSHYACQSYDHEPLDFLTKPIDDMRLQRTFQKLADRSAPTAQKISIETENGFVLFPVDEILYVEKQSRKNILHTIDGQRYTVSYSMNEMEIMLDGCGFYRCHQSFLIYLGNVRGIRTAGFGTSYCAVLRGDVTVPVSRAKYPALRELLHRNVRISI